MPASSAREQDLAAFAATVSERFGDDLSTAVRVAVAPTELAERVAGAAALAAAAGLEAAVP